MNRVMRTSDRLSLLLLLLVATAVAALHVAALGTPSQRARRPPHRDTRAAQASPDTAVAQSLIPIDAGWTCLS